MPTYEELLKSGTITTRQSEVYVVMFTNRAKYPNGITAREINEWMNYTYTKHSGVHSRLRELAEIGLVEKIGKKLCPISKRIVNAWRIK